MPRSPGIPLCRFGPGGDFTREIHGDSHTGKITRTPPDLDGEIPETNVRSCDCLRTQDGMTLKMVYDALKQIEADADSIRKRCVMLCEILEELLAAERRLS